jgi:hypothetical protein
VSKYAVGEKAILSQLPILLGGLLFGVVLFTIVSLTMFARPTQPTKAPNVPEPQTPPSRVAESTVATSTDDILVLLMTGLCGAAVVGFVGFGMLMHSRARKACAQSEGEQARRDRVAEVLMSTSIFRAALAEAAGLCGAVLIFLEGNKVGLVGVGFAVVLIGSMLPARHRFEKLWRAVSSGGFPGASHPWKQSA